MNEITHRSLGQTFNYRYVRDILLINDEILIDVSYKMSRCAYKQIPQGRDSELASRYIAPRISLFIS